MRSVWCLLSTLFNDDDDEFTDAIDEIWERNFN